MENTINQALYVEKVISLLSSKQATIAAIKEIIQLSHDEIIRQMIEDQEYEKLLLSQ